MLKAKIQADQIASMKAGDKKKLEVLRFLLSQMKYKEIEKNAELSDDEVVSIIRKQIKELKESIDAFQKGNRNDLVEQNQAQVDILTTYLPQEMSDEDLKKEVTRIVEQNKEAYEKNPKTIIGIVMKELKSKADPQRIMKILQTVTQA